MKCYNHHDRDAVGICKSCNKGICPECLTEVGNGIACTATCVNDVAEINAIMEKSKTYSTKASNSYYRNSLIFAAMGLLFLYFSLKVEGDTTFMTVFGCICLGGALLYYYTGYGYKKK